MTKEEAKQKMKEGIKVAHRYFTDGEWMTSDKSGRTYTFEDGISCPANEFWTYRAQPEYDTDWYTVH